MPHILSHTQFPDTNMLSKRFDPLKKGQTDECCKHGYVHCSYTVFIKKKPYNNCLTNIDAKSPKLVKFCVKAAISELIFAFI